jgi:L-alanine-DL-glutamate epimerase-like enolase superfamily enzyme
LNAALLDLLRQFLGLPVAALLEGQQRKSVEMPATCSSSATARKRTCPILTRATPKTSGCVFATNPH